MLKLKMNLRYHLLILALLTCGCEAEGVPNCETTDILQQFSSNYAPGDRMFLLEKNEGEGASVTCLAVGGKAGELLDPVSKQGFHRGVYAGRSIAACSWLEENGATSTPLSDGGKKLRRLSTGSSCITPSKSCAYPIDGMTSWGGTTFKISSVNDIRTEPKTPPSVSHRPVFGGKSQGCQIPDSETVVYNGGYELEVSPIPEMIYRVFQFKNEEERQLALADSRNKGLEFSKKMSSDNGCDTEVIYEFKPMSGGGLKVEVSTMGTEPFERGSAKGDEAHVKISNSMKAYVDPVKMELVISFDQKTVRETQGLPSCESEQKEYKAMRFAAQFICKSTGQRVNISKLKFSSPNPVGPSCTLNVIDNKDVTPQVCNKWTEISWDPENPTLWNPNNTPYPVHQYMSDWNLMIDPQDAPESCGSFYWDPLFRTPDGSGGTRQVMYPDGSGGTRQDMYPLSILWIIVISVGIVLLFGLGTVVICKIKGWCCFKGKDVKPI